MKKSLNKVEQFLLQLLPIVVFFSYYPVISLGANDSMNFELSLPLIWLAFFGATSLISLWVNRSIFKKVNIWKVAAVMAFPIFATLSIIWSANKIRGILTAGILWLIVISVINIASIKFEKRFLKGLLRKYLVSAAIVGVFCIAQCFMDVFGVLRETTLLCIGCTYKTLGFPHPNGLAIEPQFMGNLLILPALIALYLFYKKISSKKVNARLFGFALLSFFYIMVLYICFSRGAIYAFSIAAVLLGFICLFRDKKKCAFLMALPVIFGFGAGLFMQGIFAEISPTSENFAQGIQRSIHQISLGKIDIRSEDTSAPVENPDQSSFTGYIEESTDIRLNLNELAIEVWKKSPVGGVGIGSAGIGLSEVSDLSSKEIIQNEFFNILAELGVIGVIFIIIFTIFVIRELAKDDHLFADNALLIPAIVAFIITLCFFSGFTNVIHIYLMTPVLYQMGRKRLLC